MNPLHFLLLTIFIDATGAGLLIPIIPQLVQQLAGVGISDAALYGGAMMALFSAVQFISAPILGSISDAVGRRPVLIVSLVAFGLTYILMGMAPSMTWLLIGQAFVGLFGATHAAAGAYIADITPAAHRARRFGLVGAAFGCGFMAGPVLGGLLSEFGLRAPFFAAAGLAFANALYGFVFLPESLQPENRRRFSIRASSPLGLLRHFRQNPQVLWLLLAAFLAHFSLQSVPTTWPYYTGFLYHWGAREVGFSLGLYGLVNIVTQGFILGWLTRHLTDRSIVLLGLALATVAAAGFALEPSLVWLYGLIIPSSTSFVALGALSSCLSRRVPANEQGSAQGALAAMQNASAIVSPLLMPWMFQYFSSRIESPYAGPQFVLAVILGIAAIMIMMRRIPRTR